MMTENSKKEFDQEGRKTESKRGKRGKRHSGKKDVTPRDSDYQKGPNDVSWIDSIPGLGEIVGRVNFGRPLGYIHRNVAHPINTTRSIDQAIPGIGVVTGCITPGYSSTNDEASLPFNIASRAMWVFLRSKGTGTLVDSPNEVAALLLAEANLLGLVGWLELLNSLIRVSNPLNYYVRIGLMRAQGVDYEDMVNHQSEFAAFVAWFKSQVNVLVMPKINFITSAYEQFRHIYRDENISKSQLYMISPASIGVYAETASDAGTSIYYGWWADGAFDQQEVNAPGGSMTYAEITAFAKYVLNAILNSQDALTINGAIVKAYSTKEGSLDESKVIRLSTMNPFDEQIVDEFSEEFLMQLHNATGLDVDVEAMTFDPVIPDDANVPFMKYGHLPVLNGTVWVRDYFDMFTEKPDYKSIILASRYKVSSGVSDAGVVTLRSFEEFLVSNIYVMEYTGSDFLPTRYRRDRLYSDSTIFSPSELKGLMFDYLPLTYLAQSSGDFGSANFLGDIHNIAFVEPSVIEDIHHANLLSLLNLSESYSLDK